MAKLYKVTTDDPISDKTVFRGTKPECVEYLTRFMLTAKQTGWQTESHLDPDLQVFISSPEAIFTYKIEEA